MSARRQTYGNRAAGCLNFAPQSEIPGSCSGAAVPPEDFLPVPPLSVSNTPLIGSGERSSDNELRLAAGGEAGTRIAADNKQAPFVRSGFLHSLFW